LGGGVVPGSVILVGGDPGIGKSTLLLQALSGLARTDGNVLYVSGEESPEQIKIRAERLAVHSDEIILLSETSLETIVGTASKIVPKAMVIDSIQTMYTEEILSAPGSVSQVRDCAAKLMLFAKKSDIPVFLVGHVTKEGAIAGPRVLEHTSIRSLLEGTGTRTVYPPLNRFGSTNEIGIFEIGCRTLEVENLPSFSSSRPRVSGSTVAATSREPVPSGRDTVARLLTSFGCCEDDYRVDLSGQPLLGGARKRSGHLGGWTFL
jgi:DNA repair protein RadA/Sms